MPGIRRIELLCDLEPGEAGINTSKVRRLRAKICRRQRWQPQHANELTLDEAADVLEGVQRVTLGELEQVQHDALHHGLATLDQVEVALGQWVEVTGLSCKVIAGTVPTACPDANPVLPPSLLTGAENAIRRLYPLPAGATIHWVGHDTGVRSRCRCHPNAPFAAPFDRHRWADVVSTAERMQVQPAPEPAINRPVPGVGTPLVRFVVGDIRDLLVYQERFKSYRAGLKALDPMKVLMTSLLPSLAPRQTDEVVVALTPPVAPRLTAEAAWTLATFRRIAATARESNGSAPGESDLMQLVGSVATRIGRTVAELLQMQEGDFDALNASYEPVDNADALKGTPPPERNAPMEPTPKRIGRPPDDTKPGVVQFVRELREKKMPWKKIPDAVFLKFKVRYTSETLRGYLKSG